MFSDLMREMAEALVEVEHLLDGAIAPALADDELRSASDGDLLDALAAAARVVRRAESLMIEATGEIKARSSRFAGSDGLAARSGCGSVNELVRRCTRVSRRTASALERASGSVLGDVGLTTGEVLPPAYPALRDALIDGEVGLDGLEAALGPMRLAAPRLALEERAAADSALAAKARGCDNVRSDSDEATMDADDSVEGDAPGGSTGIPADAEELRDLSQALSVLLDQDGAEPRDEAIMRRRGITIGRARDGLVSVRGHLTPEAAAQLQRIFDAILNPRGTGPRFEQVAFLGDGSGAGDNRASAEDAAGNGDEAAHDEAAANDAVGNDAVGDEAAGSDEAAGNGVRGADAGGGAVFGPDAEADDDAAAGRTRGSDVPDEHERSTNWASDPEDRVTDDRTRAQKQHDALVTALGVAARSGGLPTIGGAPSTLVVSVRERDIVEGRGWAHIEGTDEPISIGVAAHAACLGEVQRVVVGERGRIVSLGTSERVFNARQRRAIALRDGGCVVPGCDVPAAWGEIHHVTEHAVGGPTHTDNGVLLCWFHHRTVGTRNGWNVRMIDGVPQVMPPEVWQPRGRRWRRAERSMIRRIDDEAPRYRADQGHRASRKGTGWTRGHRSDDEEAGGQRPPGGQGEPGGPRKPGGHREPGGQREPGGHREPGGLREPGGPKEPGAQIEPGGQKEPGG